MVMQNLLLITTNIRRGFSSFVRKKIDRFLISESENHLQVETSKRPYL